MVGEANNYLYDTNKNPIAAWHPSAPYGWTMGNGNAANDTNPGERHFNCTTIRYRPNDLFKASTGNGGWADDKNGTGIGNDCGANTPLTSYHAGGVHVVLGDGAVRFLSDNVDFPTFARLATRKDRQPVGSF